MTQRRQVVVIQQGDSYKAVACPRWIASQWSAQSGYGDNSRLADEARVHPNTVSNVINRGSNNIDVLVAMLRDSGVEGGVRLVRGFDHPAKGDPPELLSGDASSLPAFLRGEGVTVDDTERSKSADPEGTAEGDEGDAAEAIAWLAKARQVGQLVRDSDEDSVTFGLRRLVRWSKLAKVGVDSGMAHKAAWSWAYMVSAMDRADEAVEPVYRDAFAQVFGFDPDAEEWVDGDDAVERRRNTIHALIEAGENVWIHGPTGVGKTYDVKAIAAELDRPIYRTQCTAEMHVADLVGEHGAQDGSTVREYGVLPRAMKEGAVLILDEITYAPTGVLALLQAVLEGDDLVMTTFRGETVEAHENFAIVACDNTCGSGDSLVYHGTRPVNEAFLDRFAFVEYGHLPADIEHDIMLAEWTGEDADDDDANDTSNDVNDKIASLAKELEQLKKEAANG